MRFHCWSNWEDFFDTLYHVKWSMIIWIVLINDSLNIDIWPKIIKAYIVNIICDDHKILWSISVCLPLVLFNNADRVQIGENIVLTMSIHQACINSAALWNCPKSCFWLMKCSDTWLEITPTKLLSRTWAKINMLPQNFSPDQCVWIFSEKFA